MLVIKDAEALARALDSPLDPALKRLLATRRDQLLQDTGAEYNLGDLVRFVIVETGDAVASIEAAAGYPVITSPAFEWVELNDDWFEAITIFSDDGFGIALLVPDSNDIDASLLAVLRDQARHPIAS